MTYVKRQFSVQSPLVVPELQHINSRLVGVFGDSQLLIDTAIQILVGRWRKDLKTQAEDFYNSVSPDMFKHYRNVTGLTGEAAKSSFIHDVFTFLILTQNFIQNSIPFQEILAEVKSRNRTITVVHSFDDYPSPYIIIQMR